MQVKGDRRTRGDGEMHAADCERTVTGVAEVHILQLDFSVRSTLPSGCVRYAVARLPAVRCGAQVRHDVTQCRAIAAHPDYCVEYLL